MIRMAAKAFIKVEISSAFHCGHILIIIKVRLESLQGHRTMFTARTLETVSEVGTREQMCRACFSRTLACSHTAICRPSLTF